MLTLSRRPPSATATGGTLHTQRDGKAASSPLRQPASCPSPRPAAAAPPAAAQSVALDAALAAAQPGAVVRVEDLSIIKAYADALGQVRTRGSTLPSGCSAGASMARHVTACGLCAGGQSPEMFPYRSCAVSFF